MKETKPLSGRGTTIYYEEYKDGFNIEWGETKFFISDSLIKDILENFFIEQKKWYPLGASETIPMPRGLGEFITSKQSNLTPRHASALAAIMHGEGMIVAIKDQKPILLRKK